MSDVQMHCTHLMFRSECRQPSFAVRVPPQTWGASHKFVQGSIAGKGSPTALMALISG